LINQSRVTLNGKKVESLATQVEPEYDQVAVDGKIVRPASRFTYILLNKPRGYITSAKDERGRKTVVDLVKSKARLFPVGRLDGKSDGLVLLTDDGEMAYRLMHPKYQVIKVYRVKLARPFERQDLAHFAKGMELEDGPTAPCDAGFYNSDPHRLELHVREGRNRLVRRMFEHLGYEVESLKRIQLGPLLIGDLARGRYRHLTRGEVAALSHAVGLSKRAAR